jgi:hypothetical protein
MSRLAAADALCLSPPCDGSGTSFSINAKDDEGNPRSRPTANGQMAIKAPGFAGSIKLPKIPYQRRDFDLNGVKLYPNSTIDELASMPRTRPAAMTTRARSRIAFESPAALPRRCATGSATT